VHTHLDSCPTLVLNADFRPLSYFPLSLWSWQDAVKAVFLDRVSIVSEYDEVIRSPTFEMKVPSVIVLKEYVQPKARPAFTRFNVFLRDRWTCQYCGDKFKTHELTFDHVIQIARRCDDMGKHCGGMPALQPAQGQLHAGGMPYVSYPQADTAVDAGIAGEWTSLPAQFSARKLERLYVLGYRAG